MTQAQQDARRRFPVWLWILMAIVVFALIVSGFVIVTSSTKHSSALASHSSSPSATTSESPTPRTTPTSTLPPSGQFDSSMDEYVSSALNTQNTAVFSEGGTFTDPITVVAAASDQSGPLTPDEAVNAMAFMFDPSDAQPWDLALPASTLAAYRAGPYGYFFPVGAIVARHDDGHVFSFVGNGSHISTMYMAGSDELLLGH